MTYWPGYPGLRDCLQGDAGTLPALLRLQAILADGGGDGVGHGDLLADRPQLDAGLPFNGICLGTWWNKILCPFVDIATSTAPKR